MEDFRMKCENTARKIFQCGRFDDPLGRVANADNWGGLVTDGELSKEHVCKTWVMISRLQNQYLQKDDRKELYTLVDGLEEDLFAATTNQEIVEIMEVIIDIVDGLNLGEFPHIPYQCTNDQ